MIKSVRAASKYAKALLNLSKETGKQTQINDDISLVKSAILNSKDLKIMLDSPIIKRDAKEKVLKAIFEGKVDKAIMGLFNLLGKNKRLSSLLSVTQQYTKLYNRDKKIQIAQVTTAVPLTPAVKDKIQAKIIELTGNSATIENTVNPDILGGFILRLSDTQYDASIKNYFNELRRDLGDSSGLLAN